LSSTIHVQITKSQAMIRQKAANRRTVLSQGQFPGQALNGMAIVDHRAGSAACR